MRADATRNLDAVLQTGARLLANDPSTSIAAIATEAGVDRRTVYRRFATREALMAGVYAAKLDACEDACEQARLTEAPVTVALHQYAEGIITASRKWPVDLGRATDETAVARLRQLLLRLDAFLVRAVREGVIRPGLPDRWARTLLTHLTTMAAHEMPELTAAQGADMVTHSLLTGVGADAPQSPAPTPTPPPAASASASAQPKDARAQPHSTHRPKPAPRTTS
ncbi:TetR/AcrR family transcriptional regulator [Streptomyces sp. NPDC056149]|uniref:TetR/AcrR family transcriptional regulator n=1 Tax=Streptomyces sp. NPDC056149 TaxID=3345728 RepID=UPI0035D61A36